MTGPTPPEQRLEALGRYNRQALAGSPSLTQLVSLAAGVARTPVALLSLLEKDQEVVLANYRWNLSTIPFESSFIPRVIDSVEPVMIGDTTADEMARSNPLVTERPYIRFYGGFPLTTTDGRRIGALQVLDTTSRQLESGQIQHLSTIASLAIRELDDARRIAQLEEAVGSEELTREALKESEDRIRDLFESLDDIIMTLFADGRIFNLNKAGAEHLGFFDPKDHPRSIFDLVAHADLPEFRETFAGVVQSQTRQPVQTTFVTEYGKVVIVEGTLIPKVEDGETRFIRVIFRDVTDRVGTEKELGKARDQALTAARAKMSFLTNMSHEIRTPMNIVIGMTELLLSTDLDDDQKDLAQTSLANAEQLLTTLDNILHVSKLESGNLSVTEADFDPRTTLTRLVDVTNIMASEKNVRLELDIEDDLPLVLRGDVARVRQVLGNLISNAVKFNRDTKVTVSAKVADETATHSIVRFEVADKGVGIPQEKLGTLFDPFTQVDDSVRRAEGGMGLGLATARQLVELMGGAIGVKSKVGQGSTFWFNIPFQKISSDSISVTARKRGFPGLRVLVLDRTDTSRRIIDHYFADWGVKPRLETTLESALQRLNSQASLGEPYDLFIFDYRLGDKTGIEVAEQIRSDPATADTHLITMIPLGESLDDTKIRAHGIAGYVSKPVEQWELFDRLSSALAARIGASVAKGYEPSAPTVRTTAVPPDASAPQPAKTRELSILLAEDKPLNQKLTLSQLKALGFTADVAGNGEQVLEALSRKNYDVILMDCQMPVLDGYEATMRIRQDEGSDSRVRIIALTAHAVSGEREKCLAAGMDDYLSKPTRQADLKAALDKV